MGPLLLDKAAGDRAGEGVNSETRLEARFNFSCFSGGFTLLAQPFTNDKLCRFRQAGRSLALERVGRFDFSLSRVGLIEAR